MIDQQTAWRLMSEADYGDYVEDRMAAPAIRQQYEVTGIMTHPSHDLYTGVQTIRVTTEPNGTVFIEGVFGCSKNYASYEDAIADVQHRHSFTFKAND